jgi:predicted glycoside hydrolase/deacetylase ChbG (UPF0249 family)
MTDENFRKLIVNADDYGHTPGVSEGIRRAHLGGIVTSTTAMMNRPYAVDELAVAQALCPRLGLGVHLVLTTGIPLMPAARVRSLVDEVGRFHRQDKLIRQLPFISLEEVDAEWHAQVELFVKTTGHYPDHLDSHHHSSYFTPALFERMLRLAGELKCAIRNPFNDTSVSAADYLRGSQLETDLAHIHTLLGQHPTASPQHFVSRFYDEGASAESLRGLLEEIRKTPGAQTWEWMCHPGVPDEDLRRVSDYSDMRGRELELLTDPALPDLLKTSGVNLVTFKSLSEN